MNTQAQSTQVNFIHYFNPTDSNTRSYCVSRQLLIPGAKDSPWADTSIDCMQERFPYFCGTEQSHDAVSRIFELPGILQLDFDDCQMAVTLDPACNWSDVQDQILNILKDVYFKDIRELDIDIAELSPNS